MSDALERLGLGTAQLGMAYGVTNTRGRPDAAAARRMVDMALAAGISLFDTAPAYGDSERVLGQSLNGRAAHIIGKTPVPWHGGKNDGRDDGLASALRGSLDRLGVARLAGLLVHDCDDLLGPDGSRLLRRLNELRGEGLCEKIGVSVYDAVQMERVLSLFRPDLVQLPVNILDQRLHRDGTLDQLSTMGVEIHLRSVFLQGVLLADGETLSSFFDSLKPALAALETCAVESGLTRLQLCLGYALSLPVDHVLVGAAGPQELEAIINAVRVLPQNLPKVSALAVDDERLLNPANWEQEGR